MRTPPCLVMLLLAAAFAAACDKSDKPTPTPPTPSASATATPTVEAPKPPAPADLDVAQLQASMKCPGSSYKAACEVLEEFKKGTAWNLDLIRGADTRYFGKGIEAAEEKTLERYYFLIAKKVPLNEVGAGDLPLKLVFRQLESSQEVATTHAPKLMRLLEHDDAVNRTNQTANYVIGYSVNRWDGSAASKGVSIFAQIESGAYVRMLGGRKLVFVKPSPTVPGGRPGDGVYAILYPLTW